MKKFLVGLVMRALGAIVAGFGAPFSRPPLPPPPVVERAKGRKVCTHSFGLAGGYASCTVCGKNAVKGRRK